MRSVERVCDPWGGGSGYTQKEGSWLASGVCLVNIGKTFTSCFFVFNISCVIQNQFICMMSIDLKVEHLKYICGLFPPRGNEVQTSTFCCQSGQNKYFLVKGSRTALNSGMHTCSGAYYIVLYFSNCTPKNFLLNMHIYVVT